MKAITYSKYGPAEVLQLSEVDQPFPSEDEVLIKIYAAAVATEDPMIRNPKLPMRMMFGLTKPKNRIPGFELAGEIVATGKKVTRFKKGDQIFGLNLKDGGAYAEYKCLPESKVLSLKPNNLSYAESLGTIGVLTALPALKYEGDIKKGQKVLVNGASGSVGSAAIQIAKYYGAEVTGVCSNTNIDLVLSLGADHVIDYTKEDFSSNKQAYDIILNTVGKTTFLQSKAALKPNGVYISIVPSVSDMIQSLWYSIIGNKKVKSSSNAFRKNEDINADLDFIKELMEKGALKPVIDRTYAMEEIVDAHYYVESGRKKGNVILNIRAQN